MEDCVDVEFWERVYPIPRCWLGGLLSAQENGHELKHYVVLTLASQDLFEEFINLLAFDCIPEVTADNAGPLGSLASEFGVPGLAAECAKHLPPEPDIDDDRFIPGAFRILARLVVEEPEALALASEREHLGLVGEEMPNSGPRGTLSIAQRSFQLRDRKFLNGIIAYLTRTHTGNLHEKAVVTAISSSRCEEDGGFAPENILELESDSSSRSEDSPYQWVSWTFHFRHVEVIQYTIRSDSLRSWMLEESADARHWYMFDQRKDDQYFKDGWATRTFSVQNAMKCRYVRLIQTARNHQGDKVLSLAAVEFFGALDEPRYVKSSDQTQSPLIFISYSVSRLRYTPVRVRRQIPKAIDTFGGMP
jgi:hypothetical protein